MAFSVDDRDMASNLTVKTAPIPLIRSTGSTALALRFSLRTALSGANNLVVNMYMVPNGAAAAADLLYVAETNPAYFTTVTLTETEISGNPTKLFHFPNDYGYIALEFTRSGAGANTFRIQSFRNP